MKVSTLAQNLRGSEIIKIAGEINELKRQGQNIANLTIGDYGFIAFIVVVLIAVTMLGVVGHREALKTEGSKRNGEQWAAWFAKASETRFAPDYADAACAGGAKPAAPAAPAATPAGDDAKPADAPAVAAADAPAPGTWGACLAHLMSATEFKDMVNPFTGKAPNFIPACNPATTAWWAPS